MKHEAMPRGGEAERLDALTRQALWLSHWTVHHANHLRPKGEGEVKVGGHQASSASMVHILAALYFHALRPEDRVAVKPHASPVFHAIQRMAGRLPSAALESFRGYGGAQSYPSRTKDADDVDFSTGSVGLGVAATVFGALVQDYLHAKDDLRPDWPEGRMVALVGDAELDEGNVYEALQEGWKHDLRNCWWVIDYNRQSLDGVVREGLWERIESVFRAFGWRVVRLRHGRAQRAAFAEPGGERLKAWIEDCPNPLYSALTWQGGAAWRARLEAEIGDGAEVSALLARRSDAELAALMSALGGHCLETLCDAFDAAARDDLPTVFVAYTIKGWGTPLAGHKDNHAGLMTPAQFADWRAAMGVAEGAEWEVPDDLAAAARAAPFFARGARRLSDDAVPVPALPAPAEREISTQAAFGKILDGIAREGGPLADRILTMSPDVTVSTNLGPWVNRRGLFDRRELRDTFRDERVPSTQKWSFGPDGQHLELGIAEMNLFLALGVAGLSHALFGRRLIPVGTLYDPFVSRGLDALNYACYGDARFLVAGTPSGVSLAPEGGAHQSVATPLIGMGQGGLAAYEPAFADELAAVMEWAFGHLQAEEGGAVYLRLSTRPLEQPGPRAAGFAEGVIAGGYWMRPPTPRTRTVIAYQGAVADHAAAAAGRLGGTGHDAAVLAVTSADRLHAGWTASRRSGTRSHVEALLAPVPDHASLVTVIDGHPATLSWLGGVRGQRTVGLGVEGFGQTGTVADLHAHFGIDADGIVRAARPGPVR